MGSFSIWHWLIVLLVVALIFGTKRLRNIGEDLGNAVKGFRKGMNDGDKSAADKPVEKLDDATRRESSETRSGDAERDSQPRP